MSDNSIFPEFYTEATQHRGRTEEEGRPIFVDRDFVRIHIAGDAKNVIERPVREDDKERWRPQYEAFKKGEEAPLDGTPLSEWGQLTKARVKELEAQNIRTLEALSEVRDSAIGGLGMGGRKLIKEAEAYLKAAKSKAGNAKLAKENARQQDEIDLLKKQIKELSDALGVKKVA